MIAVMNWLVDHWYVFFWLAIFGVFEGVRDFFVGAVEILTGIRHNRRMRELRLQSEITKSQYVKPGPCVHRNVVPVVSATKGVVAWLCRTCDEKLPANWAVREEDL